MTLTSSGNDQQLVFMPTNGAGQTTVAVSVTDDHTNSVTNTFVITVTPAAPPVLGTIAPQTNLANVATIVTVPVSDPVTDVTNLTYSGTSDNTGVVSKISFAIVNGAIKATITPVTNSAGVANVTITASDAFTNASTSFVLALNKPTPPVLGALQNVDVKVGSPVVVPLVVTSPDVPVSALSYSGTSTNAALVSGITFQYSGSNEVATVHLVANKTGTDFVTITVTDGFTPASKSFLLTVEPGTNAPVTLKASLSGNNLTLSFTGTPNAVYAIQSSADLKAWAQVTNVTASGTGAVSYTAPISSATKLEFFRSQAK